MRHRVQSSGFGLTACGVAVACVCALASASFAGPMDDEKLWTLPERTESVHPRMASLMRGALDEPTQLAKIKALSEVARYKLTDLTDRVIELLEDPSEMVQTSALLTLDALDAKDHAAKLAPFIAARESYDPDTVEQMQLADAMLARWKHGPAAAIWAKRVGDAAVPMAPRVSAARSMQGGGDASALAAVVLDASAPLTLRLAAADGLSYEDSASATATKLVNSQSLIAARALAQASDATGIELLKKLAAADNSAVQAIALARLAELDAASVAPFAANAIKSPDASVRLVPAQALGDVPTPASVDLLLGALNDEHPDVRTAARASLAKLAANDTLHPRIDSGIDTTLDRAAKDPGARAINGSLANLKKQINAKNPNPKNIATARNQLAGAYRKSRWREAEQAAILAGLIDHKPAANKLIALFDYPRNEVRIATVVGLRPLNIPATHQPVTDLAKRVFGRMEKRTGPTRKESGAMFRGEQVTENNEDADLLAEVAQTLGQWKYKPANSVLRRAIPKASAPHARARASCIWAMGMIYEDNTDAKLARELILRVFDLNPNNPEAEDVRLHSMIAVGRMRDKGQLVGVRGKLENDSLNLRAASRWSLKRITGEDAPPIVLEPAVRSDAFISPLR